ncbi:MAG: LysE family transporter [Pseudomonadota bacterium]
MFTATTTGFATGFALILAIGAQNAFVLRQGLLKAHVFPLALFCALSDAILIVAGVWGFGAVVERFPAFPTYMAIAGAAFLICYGFLRLWAAIKGNYDMQLAGESGSLRATIATAAAFTWLNPHVYLDTLGLIGAVSTQFIGAEKVAFGTGAVTASFVFFFGLAYGARLLAPIMQSARAWRILDVIIALVMFALAYKLLFS